MEKLFEPEDVGELLKGWQIHANKGRKKHEQAARRLESQYRLIGFASVTLSAVIGASLFASLEAAYEPWSRIVAGIISIVASVLSSLITFHRYEERTEKHRLAGAHFKAIIQELEQVLTIHDRSKIDKVTIDRFRKEFAELGVATPVVPEYINGAVEQRFQDYRFVHKAIELQPDQEDRRRSGLWKGDPR
jgi:hypothetical protein